VDVEEAIYFLPQLSQVHLFIPMKRPDDFIAIAEKGFFVYDWRDIHRTTAESTGTYELIAAPLNPVTFDVLPELLSKLTANIKFDHLSFVDEKALNVCSYFECSLYRI
jgi:hypothetical protein